MALWLQSRTSQLWSCRRHRRLIETLLLTQTAACSVRCYQLDHLLLGTFKRPKRMPCHLEAGTQGPNTSSRDAASLHPSKRTISFFTSSHPATVEPPVPVVPVPRGTCRAPNAHRALR